MMNIRRQYNLPNCTLLLEGYPDANITPPMDGRPVMSILINAECYFASQERRLSGGREFFESLVKAVSQYAQEFMSDVPHPPAHPEQPQMVQLQRVNAYLHKLTVIGSGDWSLGTGTSQSPVANPQSLTQIDLTTVQLFDLVDAVDQFLADSQTLPELSLHLSLVPRRYVANREPMAQRVTPIALGVGGLAATAIVLFYFPIPQVQRPKEPTPQSTSQASTSPSPVDPNQSTPTPTTSSSPVDASPTPTPTTSSSPVDASPTPTPSPTASTPTTSDLEALLNSVPEITNSRQLYVLQGQLYQQISQKWGKTRQNFPEELVYRVGVGKDGKIIGYKGINEAARTNSEKTPIPELLYIPVTGSAPNREAIAQFKLVFTRGGFFYLSTWNDYAIQPNLGKEITEQGQLEDLVQPVRRRIVKTWEAKPNYKKPTYSDRLVYRVAVTNDGTIVDYEPKNQAAANYVQETSLPDLLKPISANGTDAQESLAQMQVVFKPSGVVEVGPYPK